MPITFLHPIGLDGGCWQFLTDMRLDGAVRYDMLWHGRRGKPALPLTLKVFAADVVENVAGPLDLVGLSMGGAVAQEIALEWPERVRSVMIACSSAGGDGRVQRERATNTEAGGMAGVLDLTLQRWFTPGALKTEGHPGVEYTRKRLLADDPAAFAASWRALAENATLSRLHLIAAPATVLHASEDAAGSIESKEAMVKRIPRGRLRVIPGPHMVQLESPQVFQEAVLEHLGWVDEQAR